MKTSDAHPISPRLQNPLADEQLIYGVPRSKIETLIANYESINRRMEPWTRPPLKWVAMFPYQEWIDFNARRIAYYSEQLARFPKIAP